MSVNNVDEEDDYLSASFIPDDKLDVRPGLHFSSSLKRKHEILKKSEVSNKRNRIKPIRVLEAERREEALKTEIAPDNKGFAMMQRMGYKPGTAIGSKEGKAQQPIAISLKNDRGGLGKKTEEEENMKMKFKQELEKQKKTVENSKQLLVDYQENVRKERTMKRVMGEINRCQKACEQLDEQEGRIEPEEPWYWPQLPPPPKQVDPDDSEPESEDEEIPTGPEPEEKLIILTNYLREKHLYCIWCGVKFNDNNDLSDNCPGNTYEDHE